jgi:hypothetical protein
MRIEKDFKEFLASLVSKKAKFLIIGGFACGTATRRDQGFVDIVYLQRVKESGRGG